MRYVKGTSDKEIVFERLVISENVKYLNCFVNSNYADDINSHKSTSGFVILYLSGPGSWNSKKQPIVALSSTKAKFIAAAEKK